MSKENTNLKYIAFHDQLTAVLNRYGFQEFVRKIFSYASRHKRQFAILVLDLDYFKIVNDNYGHMIGDEILVALAHRMQNRIRQEDLIARLGGDEFVVLLTGIKQEVDAGIVAEDLIELIRQPFHIREQTIYITASIGIACYPQVTKDLNQLIEYADRALYKAKESGRDNFQFYTEEFNRIFIERKEITVALKTALKNQEFYLVYQPKYQLPEKKLIGVEVLLRWQNDKLGNVAPKKFIPLAENTGVMIKIGEWVIETACAQFVNWKLHQHDTCQLNFAINISPLQLQRSQIFNFLKHAVEKYQIKPEKVEIDLPETMVISHNERHDDSQLHLLAKYGFSISVNHIGNGNASIKRLIELPINTLKIDPSIIRNIPANAVDALITKSIIHLGSQLDYTVVAIGVEQQAQYDFLVKNHCPEAQGYYFSQPLKEDRMTEFLQKNCY